MTEFAGRTAVVTGGGSGMGRELVRQLVAEACNVAMCDVSPTGVAETQRLCEAAGLPQGLRVTTHIVDVADRTQVERFRDEVADRHQTDNIHLLFNNAGISGGGSMVTNSRDEWERTFNICWGGVYNCTRAFLPMLQNAEEGHIVNTSSINGFWASVGPRIPHTAAQAATIILDGVKADRWRILVGADAHKIDEMVRQSPERAYDIGFFDEFARAAGWTERLSLENPEFRPPRNPDN